MAGAPLTGAAEPPTVARPAGRSGRFGATPGRVDVGAAVPEPGDPEEPEGFGAA
jgi:hypothetical protein